MPPEAVLAEVWQEILHVDHVSPDDDFFALGGDSLLAIKVVGAAKDKGLPLTLVQLFRNPTPRGACAGLAPAASPGRAGHPESMLTPVDQARIPEDAQLTYPATRLQLGMIYESLASSGAVYVDAVARTVRLPLEARTLRAALDFITARHEALRTRFDLAAFSEPVQLVQRTATIPLHVADYRGLGTSVASERHEQVMASIAEPYDVEKAPLLRVHAAQTEDAEFQLSYSFHHAILDGWSESIFLAELLSCYESLLHGRRPEFESPAPYSEFVRLEREAMRSDASRAYFMQFADAPAPTTLPGMRSGDGNRSRSQVELPVPVLDAQLVAQHSAQWGVPVKSMMLLAYYAAVASAWRLTAPVVGLSVSGRPETAGGDLTLGLFLNHLPVRLKLDQQTWKSAARQALEAERELLPHRRYPYSEIRSLLGRPPFEISLNYVHFHAHEDLLTAGLVAPGEDMRDQTNIPVHVEVVNEDQGRRLRLIIKADHAWYGEGLPGLLGQHMLAAIHEIANNPGSRVLPRA